LLRVILLIFQCSEIGFGNSGRRTDVGYTFALNNDHRMRIPLTLMMRGYRNPFKKMVDTHRRENNSALLSHLYSLQPDSLKL